MKKFSKFLSLLLVLMLAASVFAFTACNKDDIGDDEVTYGAYVLSDKATFLSYKNNAEGDKLPNLSILYESDDNLKNTYSMIAVDGDGTGFATAVSLNEVGADCFIKWMSLASTRSLIADFGKSSYGEALFFTVDNSDIVYSGTDYTYAASGATDDVISVSTTTSVNDSGLLGYLEPLFETATGFDLQIASAGTGAAINAAKAGNADLLLVHSKTQEEEFITAGYARAIAGINASATVPARIAFMYNFFVLIGPTVDPAGAKEDASIVDAFKAIKEGSFTFISRGDNSGTQTKETALWVLAGEDGIYYDKTTSSAVYPSEYTWFVSTGQGMGASLLVANESLTNK